MTLGEINYIMNWSEIEPHLSLHSKQYIKQWLHLSKCQSTNQLLLELAKDKNVGGYCVLADEQTQGRGRHNRAWFSEKDKSMLFSLGYQISDEDLENSRIELFSLMVGISVCQALAKFNVEPKIKWPNDIMIDNAKVAGILIESLYRKDKGLQLVVGIGINLYAPSNANFYNEKIGQKSSSVFDEKQSTFSKQDVMVSILNVLSDNFSSFGQIDEAVFFNQWQQFDFFNMGEKLQINHHSTVLSNKSGDEECWQTMIYQGIDSDGKITLLSADGVNHQFNSSDVKINKTW